MDEKDIREAKAAIDEYFALLLVASLEQKKAQERKAAATRVKDDAKRSFDAETKALRDETERAVGVLRGKYEAVLKASETNIQQADLEQKEAEAKLASAKASIEQKYGSALLPLAGGGRTRL